MKKKILIVDNDLDFLDSRAEALDKAGYQVYKSTSLDQAESFLANNWVHVAVIDVRMRDDSDDRDTSGLSLAKKELYRSIPKIILTRYPSYIAVREALGPAVEGLPPAVAYVSKKDGAKAMIEAIEEALATFTKINWNLDIQWDIHEPLSFPHLVSLLEPQLSNDILIYRTGELEDLVRKVYLGYQHIRVGRLLWRDTQRFCLPVLAQSSNGTTDFYILVCGGQDSLKQDQEHLENLAPHILLGTEFQDHAETTHFSANLYELRGVEIETIQTLRDLFQMGREKPLKAALSHLLEDVLRPWHEHGERKMEETSDIMFAYRQWIELTEEKMPRLEVEKHIAALVQFAQRLEGVQIKCSAEEVTFKFHEWTSKKFANPLATAFASLPQYDEPVISKISPGRLTADNILVDGRLQTWLTDFVSARYAPQWWDFICLEAALHFDLSQVPDLSAWQEFEQCLAKPNRLDEKLEEANMIPELRTSLALIEQIRQQAAIETGSDPFPYYAGLLEWTVEAIAHYDPGVWSTQAERLRGAHLLLAACIFAERLGMVIDASPLGGPLHLDEEGRVWLGEKRIVKLTGLHLRLLQCLSEHAGKVVSPSLIVEKVYGEKYDDRSREREHSAGDPAPAGEDRA